MCVWPFDCEQALRGVEVCNVYKKDVSISEIVLFNRKSGNDWLKIASKCLLIVFSEVLNLDESAHAKNSVFI